MKKLIYGFLIFCAFLMANPGSARAYSYFEDFTDPGFNLTTWHQVFDGAWTDTPGGPLNGIASGTSSVAAVTLGSMPDLHSTGIRVSTIFTNYGVNSSAGIFIGATPTRSAPPMLMHDDYDVITIGIENDSGSGQMRLNVDDNGVYTGFDIGNSSIDMKFQLMVNIDPGNVLFWELNQIGGSFSASNSVALTSILTGQTGVFAENSGADFEEFEVSGDAVPIPGALLLMGSGLLAVFGIRRRQQ